MLPKVQLASRVLLPFVRLRVSVVSNQPLFSYTVQQVQVNSLMRVAVLRETLPGEARVALVPESIKKLVAAKNEVWVEAGAGEAAG